MIFSDGCVLPWCESGVLLALGMLPELLSPISPVSGVLPGRANMEVFTYTLYLLLILAVSLGVVYFVYMRGLLPW